MPSTKPSSTRKIQPQEKRPRGPSNNAPRIKKAAQSKFTGRASRIETGTSTSARRKRSLENGDNDQAFTTTPVAVSKRVKTSSGVSKRAAEPEPETQSRSTVINQVPTEKLTVLIFGTGEGGELGLGPGKKEVLRPTLNPLLDASDPSAFHIVQLACGGMHTVALTADNKIITWGVNDEYALGRDTQWEGKLRSIDANSEDNDDDDDDDEADMNPKESTPTEIPSDYFPPGTQFSQVAAGDNCSFALTTTGLVYGWGTFRDSRGEQGFRYDERGKIVKKQARPFYIESLQNITQICCGDNHALALDTGGNIWAWGCNEQYQFGRRLIGRNSNPLIPHQVRVCRNKAKYIACGGHHCFAVDWDDNVYGWGANSFGEAGDARSAGGDLAFVPPTKIRSLCQQQVLVLDGGAHHSAAVTAKGYCLVWGRIDDGQLGIEFTPEQLQDSTLIRHDERNKPRICLRPAVIPTIQQTAFVACSSDHTVLIDQAGNAYSSGYGYQGQLGHNSSDDVKVMQRIESKNVKNRRLTWAGAGAQFSIIAGPTKNDSR
ncbi:hypothetical protein J3458_008752 [Metarhizium acridum]|uniref:uncharacterized protein n=1 Tax=Metarhizium acridum TaxID=92637 RepID=UPI001C6CD086|nr:hypothetical protein J3458_008752 [Metarhizium acridum]